MTISLGPSRLYIVATPIGNLEDITLRCLRCLREADVLICEDTRVTQKLLSHYGIANKRLLRLKEYDERSLDSLLRLTQGKTAALVSDSGTPTISDPGAKFIKACRCPVIPVPGPSSTTAALSISGMGSDGFVFLGFLHKSKGKIKRELQKSLSLGKAVIFFESPHRISATLALLDELAPQAHCVLARELTKIYEEILRGSPAEVLAQLKKREKIIGEFTVVVENP